MPQEQKRPTYAGAARLAGMGVEFAGAVAGFCLLGWWIDRHWQIENHKGLLVCGILGVVGAMYNLLRQSLAAARQMGTRKPADKPPNAGGPADV